MSQEWEGFIRREFEKTQQPNPNDRTANEASTTDIPIGQIPVDRLMDWAVSFVRRRLGPKPEGERQRKRKSSKRRRGPRKGLEKQ